MKAKALDVVLFPRNSDTGIKATTVELIGDEGGYLEYRVTFLKPGAKPAPVLNQEVPGQTALIEANLVTPKPDTSPSPDWLSQVDGDDDALPDLPNSL